MSYVNRKQMSGNRPLAIALVALVTITLGYALVSGLAYNVVKQTVEDLKTFDVEDEPPPPPEEPPPPPEQQPVEIPPPVVAPPPIVRTPVVAPPIVSTPVAPPPVITPTAPVAPPAPPAPPPPRIEPAQPRANLNGLITADDYPSRARRNGDEGTVRVRLTVGTNGRVTDCNVVSSSGSSDLDNQTCRLMQRRARFNPATDDTGAKVVGTHTQSFRWQLVDGR